MPAIHCLYKDSIPLALMSTFPALFECVNGGNPLVSFELLVEADGRIAARHEDVAGQSTFFAYMYDYTGHLTQVWRNGRLSEEYAYDPRGARVAS